VHRRGECGIVRGACACALAGVIIYAYAMSGSGSIRWTRTTISLKELETGRYVLRVSAPFSPREGEQLPCEIARTNFLGKHNLLRNCLLFNAHRTRPPGAAMGAENKDLSHATMTRTIRLCTDGRIPFLLGCLPIACQLLPPLRSSDDISNRASTSQGLT
jgi:hypothetical protein